MKKNPKVKTNPRNIIGIEDLLRPKVTKKSKPKKNSALDKLKAIENRGK